MKRLWIPGLIGIMFLMLAIQGYSKISLPGLVGDGMILQRDQKVKIWGWAAPGEKVSVKFLNNKYNTTADKNNKWQVVLNPMEAGGPYSMEIKGSNKITINNILIGDVWVCSGQSNMTHQFNRWQERYAKEIAEANIPEIRQFYVPTTPILAGPSEDVQGQQWVEATPESVLNFTVVGYFFAKKLYDKYHVPQGIIMTCVGGTPIEAWTSEEGFKAFPEIMQKVTQNQDTAYVNGISRQLQQARNEGAREVPKEIDKGLAGPVNWYNTSYQPTNWKTINIPGYWEDQGIRNLDGVVWYRRKIEVPESMCGIDATVKLGRIVDADELYINGEKVGSTGYQYPQREYKVPAGVLKSGKNLFVIRISNNGGKGGFVPDKPYLLLAAGDTIDLKGEWIYKVGKVAQRRNFNSDKNTTPPVRPINAQNSPSALYNGMIAPLVNYAIRGFLWYQGESNADNPQAYKQFLPNLINDWRSHWQLGNLTFLIAQLPNYMEVNYSPEESNWALLREDQMEAALNDPHTGIGVNIDLGEWNDIHPGNKKPVGERLALEAMRISYGEKEIVSSGPIYKSQRIEGNKIIISFDHKGSGLVSGNGEKLDHFAIAGKDKNFVWGNAVIENNEVVISSEEVPEPEFVRYAWADNPDFANLSNKEGLPAAPFRTDK